MPTTPPGRAEAWPWSLAGGGGGLSAVQGRVRPVPRVRVNPCRTGFAWQYATPAARAASERRRVGESPPSPVADPGGLSTTPHPRTRPSPATPDRFRARPAPPPPTRTRRGSGGRGGPLRTASPRLTTCVSRSGACPRTTPPTRSARRTLPTNRHHPVTTPPAPPPAPARTRFAPTTHTVCTCAFAPLSGAKKNSLARAAWAPHVRCATSALPSAVSDTGFSHDFDRRCHPAALPRAGPLKEITRWPLAP